jgi:hypothetical protein
MAGLGYRRFGAQGGDLGAGVSIALGARHADVVDGIHLNYLPGSYEPAIDAAAPLTDEERAFVKERAEWAALEGGYAHVHMTRPQTLAAALNDSPAGLAAWIAEKFRAWSDCDGDVARRFSHDTLLTGISLYWFSACIGSSMQMYWENRLQPMRFAAGQRVTVPIAFALSEGDQPAAAQLGRTGVRRRAVDRHAERRPFRGDGRTGPAGRRYSAVLSAFSMMGGGRVATRTSEAVRRPPGRPRGAPLLPVLAGDEGRRVVRCGTRVLALAQQRDAAILAGGLAAVVVEQHEVAAHHVQRDHVVAGRAERFRRMDRPGRFEHRRAGVRDPVVFAVAPCALQRVHEHVAVVDDDAAACRRPASSAGR